MWPPLSGDTSGPPPCSPPECRGSGSPGAQHKELRVLGLGPLATPHVQEQPEPQIPGAPQRHPESPQIDPAFPSDFQGWVERIRNKQCLPFPQRMAGDFLSHTPETVPHLSLAELGHERDSGSQAPEYPRGHQAEGAWPGRAVGAGRCDVAPRVHSGSRGRSLPGWAALGQIRGL